MSIFDTRTTALITYGNKDETFLLIARDEDEEWPLMSLREDLRMEDRHARDLHITGEVTGTAAFVRTTNDEEGWAHHVFNVAMRYQGRRMTTKYRVGTGWEQAPSVNDVLRSMIQDFRLTEFETADSLGYEPKRARQIDRQIDRQTERLCRFLPTL